MLYTEEAVRQNLRNRDGKRVFYLAKGDSLTCGARDWLSKERIEILPAEAAANGSFRLLNGAVMHEKPEHMTHLHSNILVPKTDPRIRFRGAVDTLEAELLLCAIHCDGALSEDICQILALARMLIRCEVMGEPVPDGKLCGLTWQEQRAHSHRPQDHYGQPHFMPQPADGETVLLLNRCRCAARAAELAAAAAFTDGNGAAVRTDILRALNRMSSMLYILMIRQKAGK